VKWLCKQRKELIHARLANYTENLRDSANRLDQFSKTGSGLYGGETNLPANASEIKECLALLSFIEEVERMAEK